MTTHLISSFARPTASGLFQALCGELVDGFSHAPNGDPTCPDCQRIDAEDAASLLALQQAPAEQPVKHRDFNPTANYVPRGQRRSR